MTESPQPFLAPGNNVQETPEKSVSRLRAADAIRESTTRFGVVTGLTPHAVTGLRTRAEGGWSVLVDVVELTACERLRRFTRGATDS